MAEDSLTERFDPFNQLSPSSHSKSAFQPSERIAKLELMATLLAQAEALSTIALGDAFCASLSPMQRHHYLAALHELVNATLDQLEDVLASIRPDKKEA